MAAVAVIGSLVVVVPPVLADAIGHVDAAAMVPTPPPASAGRPLHAGPVDRRTVTTSESTLTYCDEGATPESLDVYEPSPPPLGRVPAVVYIHGGGWTGGDADFAPGSLPGQVAAASAARGWVFVSIDYRLAPRYPWPAQIEDAMCAVRFLRADAAALHIDPRHIGAIGDSAGGQLAALLGLAPSSAGFDVGPHLNESSAVQVVVDLYGPADLTTPDWDGSPVVQAVAPSVFGSPLGPGTGGATSGELAAASPVTYIRPGAPPFLIMQGDRDTVVPPDQSSELARRLSAAGDPAVLVMVPGAQHGFEPVPGGPPVPGVAVLAGEVASFLSAHLGGG
jgi:acetyl esterase/lipase